MLNRTIYLWDIHSSQLLKSFIQSYYTLETLFISLWDIFDRGSNSYENYQIIKELYDKKQYDMVLWNHDLFFIFWIWLSEKYNGFLIDRVKNSWSYEKYKLLWKEALSYLEYNWGDKTLDSILERHSWLYWIKQSNLTEEEQYKRLNEIAKFLYSFSIYKVDSNNNLLVHWWIPILPDGSIVSMLVNNTMTVSSLDLLEKLDKGVKELNLDILFALIWWESTEYNSRTILYDMKEAKLIKDEKKINSLRLDTSRYFIPTWYLNRVYFSNDIIGKSLKEELKKLNINALIVWHDWNEVYEEWFNNISSNYWKHLLWQSQTLLRLDRSYIEKNRVYWNFWYAIFEDKNFIKIWDSLLLTD